MTRRRWVPVLMLALAPALFLAGAVGVVAPGDGPPDPGPEVAGDAGPVVPAGAGLDTSIEGLQRRVRRVPEDAAAWASLGLAYVQKAKVSADPGYYPKAEGVLRRSLEIDDADNFAAAAGMAALASARHDFADARRWADRGLAVNPWNPTLYGALADALIQLGRYDEAFEATQRMVDLRPDAASFSRVSYSWELRGDLAQATAYMQRALDAAPSPADRAFARYHLGGLALATGRPDEALRQYEAGLAADPSYLSLLEGRARAHAALGRTDEALRDFARVTAAVPEPGYLVEYGELLASLGRHEEARAQFELFGAVERLFEANRVALDLESARFHADHGDPRRALEIAEAGVRSRPFVEMEDAYAWALHVNGRHQEALEWSNRARRLGTRDALFHFHAGMIRWALGHRDEARAELTTALALNPSFNPRQAEVARRTLAELAG